MMTPRRFQKDTRYFHLNAGLHDRIWPTIHMRERWQIFSNALVELQQDYDATAHAFVLLGTHFHLLFSTSITEEQAIPNLFHEILNRLMNQTWDTLETPLYCDLIPNFEYYKNAYKYVYRNPVEAGLCYRAEDYEYGSLYWLLGRGAKSAAPVIDNMGLVFGPARILDWVNLPDAEWAPISGLR